MRTLFVISILALLAGAARPVGVAAVAAGTAGPPASPAAAAGAPVLVNPGFECGDGYHDQEGIHGMVPDGWTGVVLGEFHPVMNSTQMWATMGCDPSDMGYEKLEGSDSYIFIAAGGYGQDLPSPPFDAALYQQIVVTPGTAYSVSGWLTSLCGGSASPNDCPAGYYISKQIGIDPTGGTNPLAPSVQWEEDRRPHTTARWVDIRQGATAQASKMTVFVRVKSPFTWHGNHAFADAVKVVRAPAASFSTLEVNPALPGFRAAWTGDLGPDIRAIPGGNYHLLFDVQIRRGTAGAWQDWIVGAPAASASLPFSCAGESYWFRVRARAEQPEGETGASPNHRFPGVWTESGPLQLQGGNTCSPRGYLPVIRR